MELLEARFLAWLEEQGGVMTASHREIAEALGCTRRSVPRITKALERKGAIEVERSVTAYGVRKNAYRLLPKNRRSA